MRAYRYLETLALAASLLLLAFFTVGPFIPWIVDTFRMPYVDPPVSILLAGYLSYRLLQPRLKHLTWFESSDRPALLLIMSYALLLSWLSIRKHLNVNSHTDLGIFDNVLWNTIHGRFLYSSVLERNFLGEHVAPIMVLLVPLYAIFPNASTLLVVQSFALAIAALPLFWIARERLGNGAAYLLLIGYFVNRAILGAAFFDFHEIALAVPLLSFSLYFCQRREDKLFLLCLGLAVLCKEEVALVASGFGLYVWIRGRQRRLATMLIIVGLILFLVDYQIVLPFFRGRPGPYADRYAYLGSTVGTIVRTVMLHPIYTAEHVFTPPKISYLLILFGSVLYLPVLSPLQLVPIAPTLARITLSGLGPESSLDFHYSAQLIPFLSVSAVFGAEKLALLLADSGQSHRWLRRGVLHILRRIALDVPQAAVPAGVLLIVGLLGGNPLKYATNPAPLGDVAEIGALKTSISPKASIAADETLLSHFTRRGAITILPIVNDADYVLMDFAGDRYEYPLSREEHRRELLELTQEGKYKIVSDYGGVLVLEKRGLDHDSVESGTQAGQVLLTFPPDAFHTGSCRTCGTSFHRVTSTLPHLYPPGRYIVTFRFAAGSKARRSKTAAFDVRVLDRSRNTSVVNLAQVLVPLTNAAKVFQWVDLSFFNPEWNTLEFRALYPARGDLTVLSLEIARAPAGLPLLDLLAGY